MIAPGRYDDLNGTVIEVHTDGHLTVHYEPYPPLHEGHPHPGRRLSDEAAATRRAAIVSGRARRVSA